jgi:ubiquinol-cytochrome c reductase cytochrome b subunit
MGSLRNWINERWPLDTLLKLSLDEEMVGGTSFFYVFGSSVLTMFLLQAVTGIWQLLYFVPATDHGYVSLSYLRTQVPFGWLIHGLHYWGASAMIILIGLHMSRVFLWGAYKHPRQLTWLIGVFLLLFTLAMGFTGPVLPWDERGYWEAEVGTSMPGTVPYIGAVITHLLRGSSDLGQMTVSRFFFLHAGVLPTILIILIGLHLISFRKSGISGPWDPVKRARKGAFWPDQVFKDAVIITFIFIILIGLAAYIPPPFSGLYDVRIFSNTPKPEWYFLFLYQTLKAFQGPMEPVGTAGLPLFVILLMLLLPFIDRGPERNPRKRPVALVGYLVFITWVITMAFVGHYSNPAAGSSTGGSSSSTSGSSSPSSPEAALTNDPNGSPQKTSTIPDDPPDKISAGAKNGEQLFRSLGCIGCHKVHGQGGTIGPDLSSGVLKGKTRQWLTVQIRNPKQHDPNTVMPSFTSATDQEVSKVVSFLLTVTSGAVASSGPSQPQAKGGSSQKKTQFSQAPPAPPSGMKKEIKGVQGPPEKAAYVIGDWELGQSLFKDHCQSCHGPQGTDKVQNPGSKDGTVPSLNPIDPALASPDPEKFAENIDRYIQHGSVPEGPNPVFHMLPFGDSKSLSQPMISDLEAYVLHLNGVNRGDIVHPGLRPSFFFWLTAAGFGAAWLILFVLWI